MNDRLKTIVDLEKYPIQDLNSPKIKDIINKCKTDLNHFYIFELVLLFLENLNFELDTFLNLQ